MNRIKFMVVALVMIISILPSAATAQKRSGLGLKIAVENTVACGIEQCHGLEITCGPNVPEMCSMMYKIGDGCRRFARCEIQNGECRMIDDPRFFECRDCIAKCLAGVKSDPSAAIDCENECLSE